MPRPGLSSRLKHLRLSREAPLEQASAKRDIPEMDIPGFHRVSDFVYQRTSIFPVTFFNQPLSGLFLPLNTDSKNLVYFDLETTGLSSGAGTIAFLAGFGRHSGDRLVIDQFFLSDFPGEGEFLDILKNNLPEDSRLVSYNGRAFDEKLLFSRGLMHGMHFRFSGHSDLLYASRRLWKSKIGSCRLGNIEDKILQIHRSLDLPSAEVPDRWFHFLKSGNPQPLEEVFSHHRQDILSLAVLLAYMEKILAEPLAAEGIDKRSLGVWLLSRNDRRGEELLATAEDEGDYTAGVLLAFAAKRRGDMQAAAVIWQRLSEKQLSPVVCEELSKYYEHHCRQMEPALEWAKKGLASLTGEQAVKKEPEFLHRIRRLEKRNI